MENVPLDIFIYFFIVLPRSPTVTRGGTQEDVPKRDDWNQELKYANVNLLDHNAQCAMFWAKYWKIH